MKRRRHPQLRQPADGHRIAEKIDANLAAVVAAGKARETVGGMRELGAIERADAAVEHAAASRLGGAVVAHADIGDGGDGADSEQEGYGHRAIAHA